MYEIYAKLLALKGVTTADVCRATGISQPAMANWKKRRGKISAESAAKIADYFGVTVGYLMGIEDDAQNAVQDNGYYFDEESAKLAQELFESPEKRVLLDAARDVKPEDIRMFANLLKRYKQTNPD